MKHLSKLIYICMLLQLFSCKKQDELLNKKPIGSLTTISTISDITNLLNNENLFNRNDAPSLGQLMTDDFYFSDADYLSQLIPREQSIYIFSDELYQPGDLVSDWNKPYNEIYQANVVLDALPTINAPDDQKAPLKGKALFYRSIAFYNLVQTFSKPFDSITANTDMGIPLRLSSNLNDKATRPSVRQCYDQIFSDLHMALNLLPPTTQYATQASKVATLSLLARIDLAIGKYDSAIFYAESALGIKSALFDFNNIIPADYNLMDVSQYPIVEDIYHSTLSGYGGTSFEPGQVDSNLYNLYDSNDLRKTAFFTFADGGLRFKGSYEFRKFGIFYDGLATDELYLIRAECKARSGDFMGAMNDINTLLSKRYLAGTYINKVAQNADDALGQVLLERRRELIDRGLRWTDLRRLNKDPRFATTISRTVQGNIYSLPPNSPRYAIEIPLNEIQLSGIQQNPK